MESYEDLRRSLKAGEPIHWMCPGEAGDSPAPAQSSPAFHDPRTTPIHAPHQLTVAEIHHRLLSLGFTMDWSIYQGLPLAILEHDFAYFFAAAQAVHDIAGPDQPQVARSVYRLTNHWIPDEDGRGLAPFLPGGPALSQQHYPLAGAIAVKVHDQPLPLTVAPSPFSLRRFIDAQQALASSGPSLDADIEEFVRVGAECAFACYFDRAEIIPPPEIAALPMPSLGRTAGIQYPGQPYYHKFVQLNSLGKAVVCHSDLASLITQLRLSDPDGPRVLALVASVRVYPSVFLVETSISGQSRCRRLVYPIADANGGARNRPAVDSRLGSRFENGLESRLEYDPRIGRNSLLKVPVPVPASGGLNLNGYPQEQFVLDQVIAHRSIPAVVFRKAASWQPFMPDFVLTAEFDFKDDQVEYAAAFSNIKPEHLLKLLGALRSVDVSSLLSDENLLARLNQLAQPVPLP